jgi:outer membrane protein OmpA-like peptidoglycan-associated protein
VPGRDAPGRDVPGRDAPGRDGSDRDADGVPDADDACPDAPEDRDGFRDGDGCPDEDDDGDGVPDRADLCRCVAEDRDGFEDHDGCPDPDDDGDRLADACDACPTEPETYNGCADEDGCPDRAAVCVEDSRIVILEQIYFRTASAAIEPRTKRILDALAQTIAFNPQIERVRVVGHLDLREARRGAAADALARGRAEAVRAALVARGVDAARLILATRGAREPSLRPDGTRSPERDRRVSFEIARLDGRDLPPGPPPPPEPSPRGCGSACAPVAPLCDGPPPAPVDVCAAER